ncbi:MAG: type II secretion system minor pseudopilin GspJ [Endozoicomonadaceae bacterium]|nr:type II secretion system minor pseudopilin GspJ [Endozoicomonadaceae bacterium]
MSKKLFRQQGFTLLELLIAISIFSIVSGACYKLFRYSSASKTMLVNGWDRLSDIQRTKAILEQDFLHVMARPVQDEEGDQEYAFVGGKQFDKASDLLTFSRQGAKNLTQSNNSDLQRVGYAFENNSLIRYYWDQLDLTEPIDPVEYTILTDLKKVEIKFLYKKEWIDQWPPENKLEFEFIKILPEAMHLKLEHTVYGHIDWYFLGYDKNNAIFHSQNKASNAQKNRFEDSNEDTN